MGLIMGLLVGGFKHEWIMFHFMYGFIYIYIDIIYGISHPSH